MDEYGRFCMQKYPIVGNFPIFVFRIPSIPDGGCQLFYWFYGFPVTCPGLYVPLH